MQHPQMPQMAKNATAPMMTHIAMLFIMHLRFCFIERTTLPTPHIMHFPLFRVCWRYNENQIAHPGREIQKFLLRPVPADANSPPIVPPCAARTAAHRQDLATKANSDTIRNHLTSIRRLNSSCEIISMSRRRRRRNASFSRADGTLSTGLDVAAVSSAACASANRLTSCSLGVRLKITDCEADDIGFSGTVITG